MSGDPSPYNDRGQTLTVTSYDDDADRTDGDVVNQIVYAYDGWGNVATSWQAHNGKVDNDGLDGDDSPSVQYGYDSLARLTSVTYPTDPPGAPTNRVVGYSYGGGVATSMDYRLSRVSAITDGVTGTPPHFADYTYLGAGTIVKSARPSSAVSGGLSLGGQRGKGGSNQI